MIQFISLIARIAVGYSTHARTRVVSFHQRLAGTLDEIVM